ncbi:unnamed protein product, partial [Ixodes pacificus]
MYRLPKHNIGTFVHCALKGVSVTAFAISCVQTLVWEPSTTGTKVKHVPSQRQRSHSTCNAVGR